MTAAISAHAEADAAWRVVACPLADRTAAERFDTVATVDDFNEGDIRWAAIEGGQQALAALATDTTVKRSGRASLRVDYEFGGEKQLEYIDLGIGMPIEKAGLGLGLWVKGDGTPLRLRMRVVDRSGEFHQPDFQTVTAEWQYMAADFASPGGHWGGDNNGRLDYPCRLHSLVADRPRAGYKGKGSFWVDAVDVVQARKPEEALRVEVAGLRLGNVYEPGEVVRLRLSGPGQAINWRVADFRGEEIGKGIGGSDGTLASFTLSRRGWYECTIERVADDGVVAERRVFRCAALTPADPAKRNTFVGLCTHFRGRAYPMESMDLLVRYGLSTFRDEISWSSVEVEKGVYTMPDWGDAFTARAKELKLDPLLIFDYGNAHYDGGGFPNTDDGFAAYAKHCAYLADALRGRVDLFEIWNEWTVGCGMNGKPGKNTPEPYAKMLAAAHRAVKDARADATVVGIGGEHSAHHFENMEAMIKLSGGKAMDAFSVHSYRYPQSPEKSALVAEILKVADMAESHGAPLRVWVTEIGWPTYIGSRGVDERTQARYVVRTLALLQATRVVEKVYWYDFKNDGFKREYNEHNFGLVWHQAFNYAPKPGMVAIAVFAEKTAGAAAVRLWQAGECSGAFYVLPDGRELAVLWAAQGKHEVRVTGAELTVSDLMGNELDANDLDTLTEDVVYVSGRGVAVSVAEK